MHNKGDVTLVYTSRYFQPNSDSFGENNIFIGPSISKRKINVEFPLESLKDKKVIYISMGTLLEGSNHSLMHVLMLSQILMD